MFWKCIEAFLRVVDKGSFSSAAESLHITQPTITARINQLEEELKMKLFERVGGKAAKLSTSGEAIYPYYKKAYDQIFEGNLLLKTIQPQFKGSITFATPNLMGEKIWPELLQAIQTEFPNIDFNLKISITPKIIENICEGYIDIGLAYYEHGHSSEMYDVVPLTLEHTVLVCSPNHPLLNREFLSISDLKNERMIFYNKTFKSTIKVDEYLKKHGLKNYNVFEIKNLEWIKIMLKKGLGIAFLHKTIVKDELMANELIELLPLDDLLPTPLSLIFHPSVPEDIKNTVINTAKKVFS